MLLLIMLFCDLVPFFYLVRFGISYAYQTLNAYNATLLFFMEHAARIC